MAHRRGSSVAGLAPKRDTERPMENVDVVRRAMEANRSSDDPEARLREVLPLWDPACEFTSVMSGVEPRTYRGHEGIRRYADEMMESWQEWRVDVAETSDVDADTVLATIRTRLVGKQSGAVVEADRTLVCVLSHGRLLRVRAYPDRAEAAESLGLRAC